MAYRRRYRRSYRRRGGRFRRAKAKRFARRVKRIANAASETKHLDNTTDLNVTFGSVSTTWQESAFEHISQNTSGSGRIGTKIAIKSLWIEGIFAQGSSGTAADDMYNILRIVIALWRQPEAGETPFQSQSVTVPTLNDPIVKGDDTCHGMIKKYYDKTFRLESNGVERASGDGYVPKLYKFKYYKRFKKPIIMRWPGSNGTTPSCRLILSMISDSAIIPNPGFLSGFWRMTWKDL